MLRFSSTSGISSVVVPGREEGGALGVAGPRGTRARGPLRLGSIWVRCVRIRLAGTDFAPLCMGRHYAGDDRGGGAGCLEGVAIASGREQQPFRHERLDRPARGRDGLVQGLLPGADRLTDGRQHFVTAVLSGLLALLLLKRGP
jgi:hypothetical protein